MQGVQRPLSPHLQVYRWQITMWLSSLHRITGLLLSAVPNPEYCRDVQVFPR